MNCSILIIADHLDGALNPATARAVGCAATLGATSIDILVLAENGAAIAGDAAKLEGVSRAYHVDHAANAHPLAAVLAPQIAAAVEQGGYTHVFAPNTTFGKDLMPRVAATLGVAMVTDLMAVHEPHVFDRPIYAGNAVTTVKAPADQYVVATVRCASYKPAATGEAAPVEPLALDIEQVAGSRLVSLHRHDSERPDLQTATRVIAGGRGVGSEDNFDILYKLAEKLGAAVGASRAAVDAGYVPNDMQVGQTGKIIAPELYICFGVSGAIQHLAGIKDAKTIVAVNSDADAPIFEIADIGLVGDLFDVVPALENALG